jgi:hypothetical protein
LHAGFGGFIHVVSSSLLLNVYVSFSCPVFILTLHLAICYPTSSFEGVYSFIFLVCSNVCLYNAAYLVLRQWIRLGNEMYFTQSSLLRFVFAALSLSPCFLKQHVDHLVCQCTISVFLFIYLWVVHFNRPLSFFVYLYVHFL